MPTFLIRHITRYQYDQPISEYVAELRMQPRTEDNQRCLQFSLEIFPHATPARLKDSLGNFIHTFDIPMPHTSLQITAEATVESAPPAPLPESLPLDSWEAVDQLGAEISFWELLQPSHYTQPSPQLEALIGQFELGREVDPLSLLRRLNRQIYEAFEYAPQSTRVDSHIDDAISTRRGVCQDFTHIMLTILRRLGIPARYVSGYLYHRREDHDRSAEDATHAWLEAYLPPLGWVGFDPTNNLLQTERHIRVAIGRDYADVPPTQGVFVGQAQETLTVGVGVSLATEPQELEEVLLLPDLVLEEVLPPLRAEAGQQQQQ